MTADAVDTQASPPDGAESSSTGDGIGIAAFVTGCLALGPVAIVLGLVGLARWRDGRATHRSWPLAGLILGVVSTLAIFIALVLYANSGARESTTDAMAQVDAINLGNAVVGQVAEGVAAEAVVVSVVAGGYDVSGVLVASSLPDDAARDASLAVEDSLDWCLTLEYSGGAQAEVGYDASEGLVGKCPVG